MFKTLILIEASHVDECLDLIEIVPKLIKENEKSEIYGLAINLTTTENIFGLDYLITVKDRTIQFYDAEQVATTAVELQQKYQFDCILVLADSLGKMLAPRLAMKLDIGLVADITDAEIFKEERLLVRPAFSGNHLAGVVCQSNPMMASVHPGTFHAPKSRKIPEVLTFFPQNIKQSAMKLLESISGQATKTDISKSKILLSGGGGIIDNFNKLSELAELLNDAAVSASRKIVDAGIAPRAIQVGQSGKTVSPELYIALGIYGSLQHVAGLKDVKSIISVNTNSSAAICALSDIAVEGDAAEFVEKLIKKIKNAD